MWTSEVYVTKPTQYKTELEEKVYETLEELKIPYYRVETEPLISMEDCLVVNEKLQMKTVKTLFLCNQQKQNFIYALCQEISDLTVKFFLALYKLPAFLLEANN